MARRGSSPRPLDEERLRADIVALSWAVDRAAEIERVAVPRKVA